MDGQNIHYHHYRHNFEPDLAHAHGIRNFQLSNPFGRTFFIINDSDDEEASFEI